MIWGQDRVYPDEIVKDPFTICESASTHSPHFDQQANGGLVTGFKLV